MEIELSREYKSDRQTFNSKLLKKTEFKLSHRRIFRVVDVYDQSQIFISSVCVCAFSRIWFDLINIIELKYCSMFKTVGLYIFVQSFSFRTTKLINQLSCFERILISALIFTGWKHPLKIIYGFFKMDLGQIFVQFWSTNTEVTLKLWIMLMRTKTPMELYINMSGYNRTSYMC